MDKITVVDLGNMNIKYFGEKSGMFSSKISTDYISYPEGFQRVEVNEKTTFIGIGELSREFCKTERNYMAQLLYAIGKSNTDKNVETNLTLMLPTIQMKNKTKLIENLKGKEFLPKINGKDRSIKVSNVFVLPEGYATYFSLSNEEKKGDVAIIDLGSRTINLCILSDGKIQKIETVKLGSFDFYSKLKSIENAKGEDYTEEEIPRLVKNGTIKVFKKQYCEFLNEILNSIKGYVNLKTYKCIFTGGTSIMLEEYIKLLTLPHFKIHENALNSNVIGAKNASLIIWSNKHDVE